MKSQTLKSKRLKLRKETLYSIPSNKLDRVVGGWQENCTAITHLASGCVGIIGDPV